MDLVILNHGPVTELPPPSNYYTTPMEILLSLDRFHVHRPLLDGGVVSAYAPLIDMSTKFVAPKGEIFMPVVRLSFENHADDSRILLGSTPILRENTLGIIRGHSPLFH
ncbi:hypothetical protein TNCV_1387401 [Trichonephila clavipes]|nr:hypothetical protein TNCV_1387401 [Trichonephila clavipes]